MGIPQDIDLDSHVAFASLCIPSLDIELICRDHIYLESFGLAGASEYRDICWLRHIISLVHK